MATSDDDFDALPNDFDGLDFDSIPALSHIGDGSASNLQRGQFLARPASSNASSQYSRDEFDASFLAELNDIEDQLHRTAGTIGQGP